MNQDWNVKLMPHIGRHPNAYHEWVIQEMKTIDAMPNMNKSKFVENFNLRVVEPVIKNPHMLNKNYWK